MQTRVQDSSRMELARCFRSLAGASRNRVKKGTWPAGDECVEFIDVVAFDFAEAGAGEVGPRGGGMTFGYVRDLDGHKLGFHALP
jgi:hypothetical protein